MESICQGASRHLSQIILRRNFVCITIDSVSRRVQSLIHPKGRRHRSKISSIVSSLLLLLSDHDDNEFAPPPDEAAARQAAPSASSLYRSPSSKPGASELRLRQARGRTRRTILSTSRARLFLRGRRRQPYRSPPEALAAPIRGPAPRMGFLPSSDTFGSIR